jgi:hypothetical protein
MFFYFSGILEMRGTLKCHAYAFYFFAIQRHLCSNIGINVTSHQAKTTFRLR